MMQREQKYLTTSQIASRLHVSVRTLYRYIKIGLPHAKVGEYRFDPEAVDRWFEEFCNK